MAALFIVLIGLVVISVGAELLVRSTSALALRAGVSPLFVGLTVVGFGTSTPELGASLTATLHNYNDVSVGNVIGSNIFNVALILGLTACICPITVTLQAVRVDLLVMIAASITPLISIITGGVIPRTLGIALLIGLFVYLTRAYRTGRNASPTDSSNIESDVVELLALQNESTRVRDQWWFHTGTAIISLGLLIGGSRAFVEGAIEIARTLGLSELAIGLTVVSLGTSLPELFTCVVAALKQKPDIAIGNIIGSNIFNVMGILGVCATVKPQLVSTEVASVDIPVMLAASVALLPIIRSNGRISRLEGLGLVVLYGGYLTYLLVRG